MVSGIDLVKAHAYVLLVKRPQRGVLLVIELFSHENALVTCKRNRFGEVGAIDVVGGAPWTIHPVCSGFQDVVLEVVLVEQQDVVS